MRFMARRRLALIGLVVALASTLLGAQATNIRNGATLPAVCRVGDVFYKTGTAAGLYTCSATNTWTASGAGGVTVTGSPSSGDIAKFSGASSITKATSGTDYAPATSGASILYGNGAGGFSNVTVGSGLTFSTGTLAATGGGGGVSRGTFASLPAAGTAGRLYVFTDSGYDYAYDTGSAWEYYRDGRRMYDPTLQTFSWVNQGSASLSTTTGGITMTTGAGAISDNHRMRVKAAPATPYTITIAFVADYWSADYYIYGGYWRNAGAGSLIFWSYVAQAFSFSAQNRFYQLVKFNSPTSFNAVAAVQFANKYIGDTDVHWLRFSDDGTNRKVYASHDGTTWVEMFSEGRTTFLTADQVGWGLNQYTSARGYSMTLLSWQES